MVPHFLVVLDGTQQEHHWGPLNTRQTQYSASSNKGNPIIYRSFLGTEALRGVCVMRLVRLLVDLPKGFSRPKGSSIAKDSKKGPARN